MSLSDSPTYAKIVFGADSDANDEDDIYLMEDDGSNVIRLIHTPLSEFTPRWAPDGKQIAFARNQVERHAGFEPDVCLIDIRGKNVRNLTNRAGRDGPGLAFSPDGETLAFVSDRHRIPQIYTIDFHSGNVRQVTDGDSAASDPDWSPDGHQLVYRVLNTDIYTVNTDGTNQKPLLQPLAAPGLWLRFSPSWSPDGKRIAFCEMVWKEQKDTEVRLMSYNTVTRRQQQIRAFKRGLQATVG